MLKYYILEHGETIEDAREVPKAGDEESTTHYWFVLNAARYHYDNEDGWESSWPLTFVIINGKNQEVAKYAIELDFSPNFYAQTVQ
jgi:hypothetical protein